MIGGTEGSDAMRVAVLRGVRDVVVEERVRPVPRAGEVLVRVGAVGTCGSDVHYYEHGRIGDHVVEQPLVLGHEASGVVVEGGAKEPGTRVALEPGVPCGACRQCREGRYNLCPDMRFFGTPPYDGAFAEYVVLKDDFAYPIPDTISDAAAGLLEPLSVGVWACRKGRVQPGTRVLITGAGPIGLVAAQAANAFGAAEVVVTDVNRKRLHLAGQLGAQPVHADDLDAADIEPDVLLECSGSAKATAEGIKKVARAGRVVLIGMGGDEVTLPLSRIQNREIEVTGTFRYANTWPTAIALAQDVDLDRLVTHRFGLDQVEQALTIARTDDEVVKAVVLPQVSHV